MKQYAAEFYNSQAWKRTAAAYARSQRYLCELCRDQGLFSPGEIVHHKIFINERNITDPSVSLNWDNLQLVCRKHHAELHNNKNNQKRYFIDELGNVIVKDDAPLV